jgi:hypothetical protein
VSITSLDWPSTTVEGGDEDEADRTFGTTDITPGRRNSTSTLQAQDLIPPCFERLIAQRKPVNLTGKIKIRESPGPLEGGYGRVYEADFGDKKVRYTDGLG